MILPSELNFARLRRLPVIRGAEAAECGLVCLTMIARYHGHDVDLNGLRQRFALSMSGATLRSLMGFADQLGFSTRALRVEIADLKKLRTPALLHWDLNHFVVLKRAGDRSVTVHDPSLGARTYSIDEASRHFTGVVLEVSPADGFEPVRARAPVRLDGLWSSMQGFWSALLQVLGLSAALQIAVFALPFQLQLVIDEAIFRGDIDLLAVLALAFGGIVVIQGVLEAMRGWALQVFGHLLSFQMIGNIVRHLIRLPSDYFEKRHVGDILSRVSSAGAIQDILTRGVVASIIDGVMAVVAVIILVLYSPVLSLVVIAAVGLNLAIAGLLFPLMRARQEEQIVEQAREQSHLMETVRAATIVKLMGREAGRESAWRNLFARVTNASISMAKFNVSLTFVQTIVTGLQTVLVVYLGARTILDGDGFSVGMLVAFLSFRQTFSDRTNALINQFIQFRFIGLHLERLGDIVGTSAESPTTAGVALDRPRGAIRVRELAFRYGAADREVLKDVDLEIAAGEFVAFTGPSGGGKTTLMKLLLGLRTPSAGEIELDGREAAPELWRAWREHVGVVSQDDRLLSGSIADNIAFFDPDLSMDRVRVAAEAARVHDEIMRMPMQYMSLVGDMGSTLSGGQKQRVLLARALYREPRILFLDEGTANLDIATEAAIADLIAGMDITRIVVAHRPALLRRADRVLSLEDGRLRPLSAADLAELER